MKLNLGCGLNKIEGCINIDTEESCKPDLLFDFVAYELPYENSSIDEIYLFHTIEHIRKAYHKSLLRKCHNVLKPEGFIIITYPNFWECAQRWKSNVSGMKTFWENTLYGRQLFPADYHVCAMDPIELKELMLELGFENISSRPENLDTWNTITSARKGTRVAINYEELLRTDVQEMIIK
jgi:SAM-dependent methyltransferase